MKRLHHTDVFLSRVFRVRTHTFGHLSRGERKLDLRMSLQSSRALRRLPVSEMVACVEDQFDCMCQCVSESVFSGRDTSQELIGPRCACGWKGVAPLIKHP